MKNRSVAAVVVCLAFCATPLSAQEDNQSSLAEMARRASTQFAPASPQEVLKSRQAARQSVAALAERLRGEGENGRAWRRYTLLDSLEKQLAEDGVDQQVLHEAIDRLSRPHQGLELPVFRHLLNSLWRYAGALESLGASAEKEYRAHLQSLAKALDQAERDPGPKVLRQIGRHLQRLEQRRQAPQLVAAVRRRYRRPNFLFTVSQRVLDGVVEPFENDDPIRETILNTPTYGQGLITGAVRLHFVPSDKGAAIDMHLTASGDADTVSASGPVRVYSKGELHLVADKRVLFTDEGLQVSRAVAKANNRSQTKGIATSLRGLAHRLACRITSRRLARDKPAAEAEANWKAERRLGAQFDAQAAEELDEISALYLANVRLPLMQRGQFPPHLDLRTTSDRLLMEVTQAGRDQLTTPLPPPRLTGDSDLAVRLHESTVNNLAVKLLAGDTISVHELVAELEQLLDEQVEEPDADMPAAPDDELEVTLDQTEPLTLRFDDSLVSLTIRGARFVANGRPYPAMNVTIRYRLEKTPSGARAVLAEEPEIIPPRLVGKKGRFSFTELAVRRILKNRLDRDLDHDMDISGVELPSDIFDLDELPVEQLAADDGWLVFSARVKPRQQQSAAAQ